jgi:hypothetical protein
MMVPKLEDVSWTTSSFGSSMRSYEDLKNKAGAIITLSREEGQQIHATYSVNRQAQESHLITLCVWMMFVVVKRTIYYSTSLISTCTIVVGSIIRTAEKNVKKRDWPGKMWEPPANIHSNASTMLLKRLQRVGLRDQYLFIHSFDLKVAMKSRRRGVSSSVHLLYDRC